MNISGRCRYLDSQVGRPWDKVFSEICAHINRNSAVQDHVRDHVEDYVVTHVLLVNGVPCSGEPGYNYGQPLAEIRWRYWYVCPRSGILKRIKRKARKKRAKPEQPAAPSYIRVGDSLQCAISDSAIRQHAQHHIDPVIMVVGPFHMILCGLDGGKSFWPSPESSRRDRHEIAQPPERGGSRAENHGLSALRYPSRRLPQSEIFEAFGFAADDWQQLARALVQHASNNDVTKEEPTPFGTRYIVEGIMKTPDGRVPRVRTVWFIDNGTHDPRFVTAYPLRRQEDD